MTNYSDFLSMLAFRANNRKKNWREIRDALEEYRGKGVMIDDLTFDNTSYAVKITFLPLTSDEERDLAWYGFKDDKLDDGIQEN